eukprot:5336817-Alexandrium_andersonii.AAC.1
MRPLPRASLAGPRPTLASRLPSERRPTKILAVSCTALAPTAGPPRMAAGRQQRRRTQRLPRQTL